MLGCFVGPAGLAASGVPERFLDKNAIGKPNPQSSTVESQAPTTNTVSNNTTAPGNTPATTQNQNQIEPMDVSH